MTLAYLGWSIVWIAPIAATIVALDGGLNALEKAIQKFLYE